ncbi:hypothetical protein [Leucobacter iarius]|uniref:PH (Pleckstrin Homology) domain-containing protein n=1 Tax=Leucobacter iarius TaxID=333963 RepID=A0ABN2L5K8_9MICO
MRTIPEQQTAFLRLVVLLQSVPLGIMLGALIGLLLGGPSLGPAPIVTLIVGWLLWFFGLVITLTLTARNEAQLQRRLAAATEAAALHPAAVAEWPAVNAILSRAMPVRKRAAFRTALYVASTERHGVLPVAVRIAPGTPPPQFSGARLRLAPTDPAVAVIEGLAAPAEHAAAAGDPALAGLSRVQRGLSLPLRSWLPGLAPGGIALVLTAALLLLLR